jgi:diguanylate cyclase (GGDEF)-like protein/PAS domain S-box-containing protein
LIRLVDRLTGGRSLQLRFMLMVVLGAVAFSLVGGSAAFYFGQQRALASSMRSIEGLVAAVDKTFAIGAYAKDSVLLGELVGGLLRNELVREVEVHTPGGEVLARAARPSAGKATGDDPAIERRLVSPFDPSETVATLRLRADGEFIGQLAAREALTFGGFMVLQVAVLAVLLYAGAAWLVSGPIVRLARAMPTMAPGTDERLPKPSAHQHDEIGLLVDGANQLLDAHGNALRRERGLRAEIEVMEAQYRQIFDSSSAGIFVLDGNFRLINSNPTVSRVVGMSPERLKALRHDNFIERVFGEPDMVLRMLGEASDSGQTVSGDLALRGDNQQARWVHCLISVQRSSQADEPSASTIEGVIYDVTERRRAERRTRHRAEHDPLTSLKNRGATESLLDRMIDEALATGSGTTLMCLDLDGFKRVNDEFGHQAGDQVLVACAQAMRASVRSDIDLVGRVGGDEFFVVLQHVGPDDAAIDRTALALIEALRQPIVLDSGQIARIGVSIGIACMPMHARHRAALVAAADEALYEVKRSGKNSYAMAAWRWQADQVRIAPSAKALPAPANAGSVLADH